MAKRGFNGRSPKQGTPPSDRRWMPSVIFEPQETGPRNRANCKPIEPTPYYLLDDMPVFRPLGANDTEGAEGQMPKGKPVQGYDWK